MSSIVTVESTEPTISADNAKSPEAVVNEVKEAEHSDEPGASIPGIKYTYDCFNLDGRDFTETYNTPLNLKVDKEVEEQPTEEQSCIFEILTRVNVRLPRNLPENHDDVKYSLDFMKVDELKSPKMIVYSPLLLEAIREVVKYYPSQNLIGDNITIREPYSVLIHHLSDLTNLKSQLESSIAGGSVNDLSEKCRHIQVLLDFLHPRVQRTVVPTEKRLRKDPPTILFSDIWFLLKPGTISYFIRDGVWVGGIIASVEYSEQTSDKKEHWDVKVLFQDTDFKKKPSTGPAPVTIEIEGFDGEKLVTTLPVFPRHYHDAKDNGERRASLESRGALVAEILWASYKYVKYNGKLFNTSKKEYKGPLIAGICDVGDENIYGDTWTFDWVTDPGDETTKKDVGPAELVRPVNLNIENCSKEALSADHLFMMCPMMPGFALSTKTWELINVESILELDETGDIPDANIHEENLRIIKALSDRQINSKVPWSADFIKSKGEGVAVLLHGPPGVGKTYTVETIAMKTGRPLISLTIADLGTKEEAIEAQLTKWFSLAQKWRAVLLLDEADIFLERREHQDIARNGIVSAFLRKMEYFGGLLFLTTNRVGHIDEAFISRVHVIIGFEKLDPSMRKKIWESFLNKLHKEQRGKIRVTPQGVKFVLSDEMCTMEWNGREIRNAFQTAIALAEYDVRESEYSTEGDEILVEANHFKQVMDMSREFRTYMNSIRRDTEDERAKQYYGRNDRRRTGQFATHQGGQVSIGSMEPVTRDNGQRT